ncbi:hypothetical protein JCM33374_g3063 [Metschnikowia sp. JCM 33374]|nr:hypothetical protein JCM33374_g3063 [Metschnikowia sp. JCM 33374]
MSTHNSYQRQQIVAKEPFTLDPSAAFTIPAINKGHFRPIVPSITSWDSSSSSSPQSYSVPPSQVGYSHYDYSPSTTLYHPYGEVSPEMGYKPKYSAIQPKYLVKGQPMSQVTVSPLTHHLEGSSPILYNEVSKRLPSSKPVAYPVTNSLDKLPQQISKAPVRVGTSQPCPRLSVYSLLEQQGANEKAPERPHFPQTPSYESQGQKTSRTDSPCFEEYNTSSIHRLSKEFELSQDVKDSFAKLGPLLSDINSRHYSGILLELLKKVHHHITLDEMYNLLFNGNLPFESVESKKNEVSQNVPSDSTFSKSKALKIFSLILITFQCPKVTVGYLPNISVQKLRVSPTTFHKLLRNFLAIKIILASVKKVDYSSRYLFSVSRVSIYKVYYIFCRKLMEKYPTISDYPGFDKSHTLSPPRLAKLTNLIYPNILTKRLGKRGESKAHYIGLTLNNTIVDKEISRLLELDIPQLDDYFTQTQKSNVEARKQMRQGNNFNFAESSSNCSTASGSRIHSGSHVFSRNNNRELEYLSRLWSQFPSRISEQSMGPNFIWKDRWNP